VTLLEQIAKSKSPLRFERLSDRELRSYLVRAARNRWIDRWRRREVVQRNQEEFIRAIQQPATPETSVAESDLRVRLGEAVAALGSPYRDLLQALLEEDTTLAELARRRGIKRGTIYTQFRRGIDLLRAEWDRRTKEASDLRKAKK
jgi:RNA polymerase sigma factor (sigma-70 family)